MNISERERIAVRGVLEALGDRATPAPNFEALNITACKGPAASRRRSALVGAALMGAVGLAVFGVVVVSARFSDDRVIETVTAEAPPDPGTTPGDLGGTPLDSGISPATSPSRSAGPDADVFVPPRFSRGDRVMYPAVFLDGTRVALWLPAGLGFDATSYSQAAELRNTVGDLPAVRVDVTNCVGCGEGFTAQYGPWELTASGDGLSEEIWARYVDLLEPTFTPDGYLTLGGEVELGPIDSPDVVLRSVAAAQVSVFARTCTPRFGETVTQGRDVGDLVDTEVRTVCEPDQGLEAWLPSGISDTAMTDVGLEFLAVGPLVDRSRDGVSEGGPLRVGSVVVTSGGLTADRLAGYDAATSEPLWEQRTRSGTSLMLGAVDGAAIVAGQFGPVLAIGANNGTVLWTLDLEEGESPGVVAANEGEPTVYLPTTFTREGATLAPRLRVLDASTGDEIWRRDLNEGSDLQWARPALTSSLVLLADTPSHPGSAESSYVNALDRETGALAWRFDLEVDEQGFHYQAILADDSTAYVVNLDGVVLAIDLETGLERWRAAGTVAFDVQLELRESVLVNGQACYRADTGTSVSCP